MNEYTVLWPRDDIDPKKKNNNWLSQVGRAIFYRYENNKTYYSRHDLARLFEIKNYSEGRQSPQKYIDMWASRGDEKTKGTSSGLNMANARGKRKGYANIDFTPFSMAPEIKRIIMSVLGTENQRIQVDSINPDARNQRALKKYQLYIKSKLDPILRKIGKPQVSENEFVPENITELELYETLGGFKLNFEIGIEKLAEFGLKNSDWTKIERQLKDDAMNFGFVVVKDYTDPDTGMAKVKYIDVTKFVCAWTDESQGDNSPFGGHFQKYSLPEVRKILLQNGYSEDETEGLVSKIAKWSYDTVYANDRYGWSWYSQRDTITDRMRYDDFFVDVLEFEYISKDSNYFKKRNRDGSVQFYKDMFGDVVNTEKKKTVVVDGHFIYEGYFLPGANVTVGGKQKNMKRVNKQKPQLSYRFLRVPGKSITETAMPIYDSMQINHLKLQAAKLAAAPKGIAIDVGALNINSIAGTMFTPFDLVQVYSQTGNFFYKSSILGGKVNTSRSFEELEGGIGKQLAEWITAYQHDVEKLLQITGITPTMAGSPAKGDKLVGIAELEVEATNNALWPLQQAIEQLKIKAAENIILRALTTMRYDKPTREYYSGVFGQASVDAMMTGAEMTLDELGLSLSNKVSQTQKFKIMEAAETALKVGRNGMPEIELADYTMIIEMLEKGRIKEATWYLNYKSAKKRKYNDEMTAQNQQAQSQSLIDLERAKLDAELAKIDAKKNATIEQETVLSQLRIQEMQALQAAKTEGNIAELKTEAFLQEQTGAEITGSMRKK
jgi:hypothetical protein